jgi:signal transduction histidine kinase
MEASICRTVLEREAVELRARIADLERLAGMHRASLDASLESVRRLKSELVTNISHELRTPLASVLGFVELLATRDLDQETSRRYLQTIHTEARRLGALMDDILDLEKIQAGCLTLALETLELADLVRHESELFSGESLRHRLEYVEPEQPIIVVADRMRISSVIAQLLSNARKFSPAGGAVVITATCVEGIAQVCVSDSGLGIPAGQERRVFTTFFRADDPSTRSVGGAGLGLAVCHGIVDAHGGRMGFATTEGKGSSFWFDLPTMQGETTTKLGVCVDDAEHAAADSTQFSGGFA